MFCANCGAQVPDGTKFCPSCGKPCSTGEKVKQAAEDVFNKSEQELRSRSRRRPEGRAKRVILHDPPM